MHEKWRASLLRTLVCGLGLPDSIHATDAHRHCDFGRWLYSRPNEELRHTPAFQTIEALHRRMHDCTREACLKSRALGRMTEEDYDDMNAAMSRFEAELKAYQDKVRITVQQMAS